jgi:two-component system sensor histidine kinase ChiS
MLRQLLAPIGFRGRLLMIFLAISTLPLAATAIAFFYILNGNAEAETQGKLAFVRDAKRSEVVQYLTFAVRQAENLTSTNAVRYSIGDFYGFSYAFRQIDPSPEAAVAILHQAFGIDRANADGTPATDDDALIRAALEYANAHNQFHDDFAGFVRASEFDNIYLVNADRRVVYSVTKDGYLGADLDATMRGTPVAQAVETLLAAEVAPGRDHTTVIRDFERDPVTGAFAAYVVTLVEFYHRVRGAVVFRLPVSGLDGLVQSESGATGGLFLLNGQQQVLSAPPASAATTGLGAGAAIPLARSAMGGTGAATLEPGLAGEPALSAWTTLDFLDLGWTLAAEVPTAVAFADSEALRRIVLMLAALSLPVLLGLAIYLSRMMTAPLNTLTDAAEAIAEGDLERAMPTIDRPSEFERLTRSFRRMRDAVREQLGLIGEKNSQLEEQVRLIEQKNAELEETDRLKDTFLANTSHELRTPLNGIIGISETLSAGAIGDLTSEQRSQLQLITFSARRLSRLVDDLLDLYRIRHNQMRLDIHPVHVASSIRNILQLSEPLLRGEPVTLRVDVPETIPFVQTDPVRFEQILYNLLGNAIKYTDQGSILIFAEAQGEMVAISVEDTGCGISNENLGGSSSRSSRPSGSTPRASTAAPGSG